MKILRVSFFIKLFIFLAKGDFRDSTYSCCQNRIFVDMSYFFKIAVLSPILLTNVKTLDDDDSTNDYFILAQILWVELLCFYAIQTKACDPPRVDVWDVVFELAVITTSFIANSRGKLLPEFSCKLNESWYKWWRGVYVEDIFFFAGQGIVMGSHNINCQMNLLHSIWGIQIKFCTINDLDVQMYETSFICDGQGNYANCILLQNPCGGKYSQPSPSQIIAYKVEDL